MPEIDMSDCPCCGGCCIAGFISLGTPSVGAGDCLSCAMLDFFCAEAEYRMVGGSEEDGICTWVGCCVTNPCFEQHEASPDCGFTVTPALVGTLTDGPGTTSGRKITLEFAMTIPAPCDTPRIIARYELDDVDPSATPCCGIELPKVFDDGTCSYPATMTIECTDVGCNV